MHDDSLFWKYGGNITLNGFLIQNIAEIQSVDALIGIFYFQEWAIFCLRVITHSDSFEKPVWGNIQIIPWRLCSGDAASAKCKVKVDSYKSCSMFRGMVYSLVRIWWRPNCKLTNGSRPSKETLCIPGLSYFLEPWLWCLLLVRSNRFKTFTDWHPGLVRFPILSMWSLQPYGAVVPSTCYW